MTGIILAAGRGTRLNGMTGDGPKCLVRVGGQTLLERQIHSLHAAGIDDVRVVIGCEADRVRREVGRGVQFVDNPQFAETNSLYSLWLTRDALGDGFVGLNCDVLFDPQLLVDLVTARHEDALLVCYRAADDPPFGDEEMKVKVRGGRVVDIAKTLSLEDSDAENLGMVKFGPAGARLLVEIMDALVAEGRVREWAPRAFQAFCRVRPLHAIGTRGYPWTEIDFPEDYERAVNEVLPAIEAGRRSESESRWLAAALQARGLGPPSEPRRV